MESTPSMLDSFQSGEVQVGLVVEFPCIASGYPNPTIRWLKDGRPLPADSRWTRRTSGLTISDLRLEDSGNYICEVTNSFGSKEVTGHLNVIGGWKGLKRVELNNKIPRFGAHPTHHRWLHSSVGSTMTRQVQERCECDDRCDGDLLWALLALPWPLQITRVRAERELHLDR